MIAGNTLVATMLKSALDARLATSVGQKALTDVMRAMAPLMAARLEIISAHETLRQTADSIGLREMAIGDLVKPPLTAQAIDGTPEFKEPHLKIVG
jgi:hypothetical protein